MHSGTNSDHDNRAAWDSRLVAINRMMMCLLPIWRALFIHASVRRVQQTRPASRWTVVSTGLEQRPISSEEILLLIPNVSDDIIQPLI